MEVRHETVFIFIFDRSIFRWFDNGDDQLHGGGQTAAPARNAGGDEIGPSGAACRLGGRALAMEAARQTLGLGAGTLAAAPLERYTVFVGEKRLPVKPSA